MCAAPCAGVTGGRRGAGAAFQSGRLIGYAAGGAPWMPVAWSDRGTHAELARILVGLEARLTPPARFGNGYNSATIRTDTGDDTVNARDRMTDLEWAKVRGQRPPDFFLKPFEPTPAALDELREFGEWCRAHQVRLVVTFPPTIFVEGAYDDTVVKANADNLIAALQGAGLTTIGRPDDFRYPPDQMFDTAWHLNDVGREAHTHRLAVLLAPLLTGH